MMGGVPKRDPTRLVVSTDAHLMGWSAHLKNSVSQYQWSPAESAYNTNLQELVHKTKPPSIQAEIGVCVIMY